MIGLEAGVFTFVMTARFLFSTPLLAVEQRRRQPHIEASKMRPQQVRGSHAGEAVNFQVTVLKVLISYPDGFATIVDLKRDVAILATSGRDWAERTKRLAARAPGLDIFSQGLVERLNGGWRITDKGRSIIEVMEARPAAPTDTPPPFPVIDESTPAAVPTKAPSTATDRRKRDRKRRRRDLIAAWGRAKAS